MKTTETHGPPTSKHQFNQKLFIQEIEKAKHLWDTSNLKYKDQMQTDSAWERIGNHFKIPKLDAMRRWTVMRAKYRQEKQISSKSVWPLFSSMIFLDNITTEKQSTDKSYNRKDNQKRSSGGGGSGGTGGDSSSSSSTTQHKSGSSGNNDHHRRSSGSSKDKPYSRHNKYGNSSSTSKDNKLTSQIQNDSRSSSVTESSGDTSKSSKPIINDVKIKTEPIDQYENNKNIASSNDELLLANFPEDDDNEFIEVQIIDGDDDISMSENGLLMGLSDNIIQQINNSSTCRSNNNHKTDENDIVQQGYESKCRAFGKYIGEELCSMKDEGGNAIIMQIMHLILQAKNK